MVLPDDDVEDHVVNQQQDHHTVVKTKKQIGNGLAVVRLREGFRRQGDLERPFGMDVQQVRRFAACNTVKRLQRFPERPAFVIFLARNGIAVVAHLRQVPAVDPVQRIIVDMRVVDAQNPVCPAARRERHAEGDPDRSFDEPEIVDPLLRFLETGKFPEDRGGGIASVRFHQITALGYQVDGPVPLCEEHGSRRQLATYQNRDKCPSYQKRFPPTVVKGIL